MRTVLLVALVALSSPAFASANDRQSGSEAVNSSVQANSDAKSEDPADKKICKRVDATESRLGSKKVCLTAEQWKQRDQESSSW